VTVGFPGACATFSTCSLEAILLLREEGFAGATVVRGIAGFDSSARIRTNKVPRPSLDLPNEAGKA
jgi:PII-like signaling protein